MSKVKEQNYLVIQGWMLSKLQLKGNDLLIYAIIYGFSQNTDCKFTGSLQYLADWTNSTKQGVINSLKNLLEKELITKKDYTINSVKFVEYYSNDFNGVVNKVEQGYSNNFNRGSQISLPNNTNDKLIDNSIINNINTANSFSQSENSVVNNSLQVQKPTIKESLTVQKQKKEEEVEVIPNCIDISKWEEWKSYKKEKKQKLTKSTAGKQLQNLQKWHLEGQDPNEIIDNSISNGWAGLFPLKQQKPTFNNQYAKPKLSTTSQVAEMFRTQAQYIENNKQTNDDEDEHPF